MERCTQCNSTLAKDEKICWACNSTVPDKNPKAGLHERFQVLVNGLFIFFAVLSIASIFAPAGYTPSFMKCLAGVFVMGLVRSSIQNMSEAKKD